MLIQLAQHVWNDSSVAEEDRLWTLRAILKRSRWQVPKDERAEAWAQLLENDISNTETIGEAAIPYVVSFLDRRLRGGCSFEVLERAIFMLARIGGDAAREALTKYSRHEFQVVRANAVRALSKLRDENAETALTLRLSDPDWSVRCYALDGLAVIGGQRSKTPVYHMLNDSKIDVRTHAVKAVCAILKRVDDPQMTEDFLRFLKAQLSLPAHGSERYSDNRSAAVGALTILGGEAEIETVIEELRPDGSMQAPMMFGTMLRDMADERLFGTLVRLLECPDVDSRNKWSIGFALGRIDRERAIQTLNRMAPNAPELYSSIIKEIKAK